MSLRICKIFLRVLRSCLVKYTKSSRLHEFVWVVASPPWRRGPQVRAPWHHECHGAVDIVGPVVPPGAQAFVGTQECTQIGENGLSEPFWCIRVHCCAVVTQPGLRGTAPGLRRRAARAASRRDASWSDASRKGAVCGSHVAQNALFRYITAREAWGATPPPACGALWKVAQLGKCARATPRQAAGGLRRGPAGPGLGPDCTEKRSLGRGPR